MGEKKSSSVSKNTTEENRKIALDTTILELTKKYGKGAVMRMSEKTSMNIQTTSTGSIALDYQLGVGGLPRGRIIEIYGPESSGKTTLTLHCIAELQKAGGTCAFIDAEHAMDPIYAKNIGVDIESLLISQPDCGEQALEIAESLARSGAVDMIVIDSVAALTPEAEINGEMGDASMGLQARLLSKACRKLTSVISSTNCTLIFINQLREKIGVMFGSPETTTGGRALKFFSSVRLDIRKTETIKSGGESVSNMTKVKVVKNKVAPPFKECTFEIVFGKGIDSLGEILDMSADRDIVEKAGSWYSYNGAKIGQGRDRAKEFLKSNPEICEEIKAKLLSALYPEKQKISEE